MPTSTLEALEDAWIDEANPDTNNDSDTQLEVRSQENADRRAAIEFDMDQLPADFLAFTDEDVTVLCTVEDPASVERTIELWQFASGFDETQLTWNNRPADAYTVAVGSHTASQAGEQLAFDLIGLRDEIPTSGPWALYLRHDTEDETLGPFDVTLYGKATTDPPVFRFTYRAENQAEIDSQLMVLGSETLDSQLTPRLSRTVDLDAAVRAVLSSHLLGVVEVHAVPIADDHTGRARGRVSIELEGALEDVQAILDEVGTTVDVDGEQARAIVHLVDEAEKPYPRQWPGDPARLSRGDAVLFALGDGSTFEPGEVVAWQDRRFRIVGALDEEPVTDEALFREMGLRRLATTHLGRAQGTVSTA